MLIHIQTQELEKEFINPVKNGFVSHPVIDYQTNAVHTQFEGKDVIISTSKSMDGLTIIDLTPTTYH